VAGAGLDVVRAVLKVRGVLGFAGVVVELVRALLVVQAADVARAANPVAVTPTNYADVA
jgi:hypothetical protein